MLSRLSTVPFSARLLTTRVLARLGLGENAFLLIVALIIGVVTAAAAVSFHELIHFIRDALYARGGASFLYGRGVWLLILIPALGGLCVAIISRHLFRQREGHGIVDVMESVMRSGGVIPPMSALEKILTSAITIGTGGSAGAEGPIVQIGAGIASGIGQLFRLAKPHMPVLIGCGSAAGISAIFNSPIGGLLFTLEVILQDFSIRTLTPLVIASVMANFATQTIFRVVFHENYSAIFTMPPNVHSGGYTIAHVGNFALLGIACGLAGVALTRLMYATERAFARFKASPLLKPAIGGALLGVMGVIYVLVFGRLLLGREKFIPFEQYAMPAFFGDGYGAVKPMLGPAFYTQMQWGVLLVILLFLIVAKLIGTCFTLGSGGAGGIIAPSLFLGAVTGGALGMILQHFGFSQSLPPHAYALIGMGAVLAAVVHAPLAAVLILADVTRDYAVILPAMLATVMATGMARFISRDSIYTLSLRLRGVRIGAGGDLTLLRRLTLEQVKLEPATVLRLGDPLQRALDLTINSGATDMVIVDERSNYVGMLTHEDIHRALIDREAVPLLLVSEIVRLGVPVLRTSDSLATVLDQFGAHDLSRLPVGLPGDAQHVIGLVSRAALMRRYQQALDAT